MVSRELRQKLQAKRVSGMPRSSKAENTLPQSSSGVHRHYRQFAPAGIKNSSVLTGSSASGRVDGGATIMEYIFSHKHLIPKRQQIAPQGNRGRRYRPVPVKTPDGLGFHGCPGLQRTGFPSGLLRHDLPSLPENVTLSFSPMPSRKIYSSGMIHAFSQNGIPRVHSYRQHEKRHSPS